VEDCQFGDFFFKNPHPVKKSAEAGERSGSRTGLTGVSRRKFWSGQAFVLVQSRFGWESEVPLGGRLLLCRMAR
jgi:hypothetical protein